MRRIVILLGPPGAGKGMVSSLLVSHFAFARLSSGELLRAMKRSGDNTAQRIAELIDAGEFVPDEWIISLIEGKLADFPSNSILLLDGFPRTLNQAVALDTMLSRLRGEISIVMELQADNRELERRILRRAEEEGRDDDNLGILRRRLRVFHARTAPLIDFYSRQRKLHSVDAMGSPAEVLHRASLCIRNRLPAGVLSVTKEAG